MLGFGGDTRLIRGAQGGLLAELPKNAAILSSVFGS